MIDSPILLASLDQLELNNSFIENKDRTHINLIKFELSYMEYKINLLTKITTMNIYPIIIYFGYINQNPMTNQSLTLN